MLTQGDAAVSDGIGMVNAASGPADALDGSFIITDPGFDNTGFGDFTGLAQGLEQGAGSIGFDPGSSATGTFTETFTLTPVSDSALGQDTLTPVMLHVEVEVVAPVAAPDITPNPIDFGEHHVNDVVTKHLTASNPNALDTLDVGLVDPTGGISHVSGTVSNLAPGAHNTISLVATLDTSTAGLIDGGASATYDVVGQPVINDSVAITGEGTIFVLATMDPLGGDTSILAGCIWASRRPAPSS